MGFSKSFSLFCFIALILVAGCGREPDRKVQHPGETLASTYCAACHSVPPPDALSKDLWRQILPRMGARMGMNFTQDENRHYQELKLVNLAPTSAILSKEAWDQIQTYYLVESPDTLPAFITSISAEPNRLFKARPLRISNDPPAASLVKFGNKGDEIWYGDAERNVVYQFNLLTGRTNAFPVSGAPSALLEHEENIEILTMGDIFPNDLFEGEVIRFAGESPTSILTGLPRPVDLREADLNNDGSMDYVVAGFGFLKGSLSWFEKTNDGYREQVLRDEPGALRTEILDLNDDGYLDILALMAQGQEGFYVFLGDGQGNFTEKQVSSFPSYYGSSYFELADMNGDGKPDIVYANGDTGDYNYPALKPYHAVRILIQEAPLTFTEKYVFPIHGPFSTMADDYDGDGDMDLAVISYFPDYTNTPDESFLILENKGNLSFVASSISVSTQGKWLTADRGDFDHDGDIDILLGNGPFMQSTVPSGLARSWQQDPADVMLLENLLID
ncbi:FG-GAP repeat domain-containing protein [Fulvivirga sedimenti]|uniref:VCBS repeat-containing protein n=1 Tax=Fulvivirga sedimenti TaxID=2879465 RepID=A0A9X1HVX7_9BACT|nr:VCBS repeat-containing protein [Fulvivirga sedimenti]MCA6078915.1 VCBS repeat-containing protein [Fulvivirga sedimenti]